MTRNHWIVLLVTIAASLLAGCDINRHAGAHGQILFEYYSDKDRYNFNKPIIEGGYLDVFAYDIPANDRANIREVVPLDTDVARVEGHVDHLFVPQGLHAGRAKFEVEAVAPDGRTLVDTISFRVDRPAAVTFDPEWARAISGEILSLEEKTDDHPARLEVTTGARIEIPWTRWSAGGEALVGYGVHPIAIQPEDGAKIHDRLIEDDTFTLFVSDTETTFEVVPGDCCDGERLVVEVVEPDPVTSAQTSGRQLRKSALSAVGLDNAPSTHGVVDGGVDHPHRLSSRLSVGEPGLRLLFAGRSVCSTISWILAIAVLIALVIRSRRQ